MKKKINRMMLTAIMAPMTGWADIDVYCDKFINIDPNDETTVRSIIEEYFVPFIENNYTKSGKLKIKEVLGYFLTTDAVDWKREFDSCLMPFDHPYSPKTFFLWLWDGMFPNEDFLIPNPGDYEVIEDYADYHGIIKGNAGER